MIVASKRAKLPRSQWGEIGSENRLRYDFNIKLESFSGKTISVIYFSVKISVVPHGVRVCMLIRKHCFLSRSAALSPSIC